MNNRSYPPRYVLSPGMEVWCYKQQGKVRRLHDRETAPQGPALMVAMEGVRNVWLRDHGSLWKTSGWPTRRS